MNDLIKIIASDLDGTLLKNDGKIHQNNLKSIKKVSQNRPDINIIIATGTGPRRTIKYAKECGIDKDNYMICYNGGAIIHIIDGKINVVEKNVLSGKQFTQIITIVDQYKTELQVYDLEHKKITHIEKINSIYKKNEYSNKEELLYKAVLFFPDDKQINNIVTKISAEYPNFQISTSKMSKSHEFYSNNNSHIAVEINQKGTNKGQALEKLCEILDVKPEHVIACGDEMNDKEMLEFAKHSYAMANANIQIKKIAKYETKSNENAGVAETIEKTVFSQEQKNEYKKELPLWDEFIILMSNYENLFEPNCVSPKYLI